MLLPQVTTIQDARFANTLELAVRFGKTLVVDEVDTVEPILYTVLRRDLLRQGTRLLVQIGEKTVPPTRNLPSRFWGDLTPIATLAPRVEAK